MKNWKLKGMSSFALHILAMTLMLCDHMWATLFPAQEWLTCIGRMAFPILAELTALVVESYKKLFGKENGRQGYHSKAFQYVCYAFYPVHLLILYLDIAMRDIKWVKTGYCKELGCRA